MMYVKKYEFIVFELRGFAMQIYYDIICWIPRWAYSLNYRFTC